MYKRCNSCAGRGRAEPIHQVRSKHMFLVLGWIPVYYGSLQQGYRARPVGDVHARVNSHQLLPRHATACVKQGPQCRGSGHAVKWWFMSSTGVDKEWIIQAHYFCSTMLDFPTLPSAAAHRSKPVEGFTFASQNCHATTCKQREPIQIYTTVYPWATSSRRRRTPVHMRAIHTCFAFPCVLTLSQSGTAAASTSRYTSAASLAKPALVRPMAMIVVTHSVYGIFKLCCLSNSARSWSYMDGRCDCASCSS